MFENVVNLYRRLGKPLILGGEFSYAGQSTPEIIALIDLVAEAPSHFGYFQKKNITANSIDVEFCLPATEYGRFHDTFEDFLTASPSLEKGKVPSHFYICTIDYYSGDDQTPEKIRQLQECCEFIQLLSKLAADSPSDSDSSITNRLVFILAADGKSPSRTFTVRTKIDSNVFMTPLAHLNLLRAMLSDKRKDDIHVEERRMIMQMAISEILSEVEEKENMFAYLVNNWKAVLHRYRHNFQAFIHQYSFEKVRKEIANAEIEHATRLSGVFGDIAGKLLALPVSLGGIMLLRNAKDITDFSILSIGLFVISVIFFCVLLNQWLQVCRLRDSFDIIWDQYKNKLEQFPKQLREPIVKARQKINSQKRVLKWTFFIFYFCAALPIAGIVFAIYEKNTTAPTNQVKPHSEIVTKKIIN